jgi:hypothetical protein
MKRLSIASLMLAVFATGCATAPPARATEEKVMQTARGEFEVKLTPQAPDPARPWSPGRMLIDKQFRGDLEGTSSGEMLAVMTSIEGSAGYVAMERVTATLAGRSGTFALQHSGTMTRGTPSLVVSVVPDSGTEGFEAISGEMTIDIADGKHSYTFRYRLP